MGEVRSKVVCGFAGGSRQYTVVVLKCFYLMFIFVLVFNFIFYCYKIQVIFIFQNEGGYWIIS